MKGIRIDLKWEKFEWVLNVGEFNRDPRQISSNSEFLQRFKKNFVVTNLFAKNLV